jgi:hypothetical protein
MLTALCMSFALGAVYEDEQGGLTFLRSLPLKSGTLVLGRYLAAIAALLILVACVVMPLAVIRPDTMVITGLGGALFAAMSGALIMVGLVFTLFYRYGYRAVRSGFLMIFLVMMSLQVGITTLGQVGTFDGPPPAWIEATLEGAHNLVVSSLTSALILALISVLLIYALLACLSVHSLRKRDL